MGRFLWVLLAAPIPPLAAAAFVAGVLHRDARARQAEAQRNEQP